MVLRLHIDQDYFMSINVKLLDYGIGEFYFKLIDRHHLDELNDIKRYASKFQRFEILEDAYHETSSHIGKLGIEKWGDVPILAIFTASKIDWKLIGF